MTDPTDVHTFTERVCAKRDAGTVTSAWALREPDTTDLQAADALAIGRGFRPLGAQWRPVDEQAARRLLCMILERDLAYGLPVMAPEDAAALAEEWLRLTPEPRILLTNGTSADGGAASWSPISSSTFDAGVIAIGGRRSLLLWVEDED